jgi:hypothetical protein
MADNNADDVAKFIRNFHTGDYDAEFDDALSFDRNLPNEPWSIACTTTQASYIKPDNWVERNRIGLEKIREHLQTCIDKVSLGHSFDLELTHNTNMIWDRQLLMDGEEPIVWHEKILDEYWDRLEAKMNQLDIGTDIKCIDILNVEITKERLAALVAMFLSGRATNSSKQQYFAFNNANLCREGITWMSKLVDVSLQLKTLTVSYNRIDNMESARCISRSLKSHSCIENLHLINCDLGSSPEILLAMLQSDVLYMDLSNNNIDSLGAVKIAKYLEGDPPINELSLHHNRLNDNDATHISHVLKRNRNLEIIGLSSNNFTSIGVKALLSCVFDGSSLNAISESNHTLLEIDFFDYDNKPIKELHNCIDKLLGFDRTQKIVLALHDKDSLLQYLANVPVELIPEVLAFPLRQVEDHRQHTNLNIVYLTPRRQVDNQRQQKHLNILYYTMRWWNMPMLYSYHNCVKSDAKRNRNESSDAKRKRDK